MFLKINSKDRALSFKFISSRKNINIKLKYNRLILLRILWIQNQIKLTNYSVWSLAYRYIYNTKGKYSLIKQQILNSN